MTGLGIALMVVGVVALVAEAHLPTFGALGALGIAALGGGAYVAIDAAGGGSEVAIAVAVLVALLTGAFVIAAARKAIEVSGRRARGGADGLVGRIGVVRAASAPLARVFVAGELWQARSAPGDEPDEHPLGEGDPVVVERVDGLVLRVRRAEEWELPA
jgi:membrane-bound ClpP family serine protease